MDLFMRAAIVIAFVPLVLQWTAILAFLVPRLGTLHFLRLHYTAAQGVDWVDVWYAIFLFPMLGLATFAVNLAIAMRLGRRNRSLGHVVMVATAFIEAMLAVSGIIAVLLNG
jgi:hypothetical protein